MKFQVNKPIRLIELFSGVGFTRMALEAVVGRDGYESWRTCEWDVNAMRSYAAIHCYDDTKDYSEPLNKRQLIEYLITLNLSTDGKKPLTPQQIGRKGERWLRETYNNIQRTDNICDISQAAPEDLWIEDTQNYTYILTYSWPCTSISQAGSMTGMKEGSGTASSLLWEIKRLFSGLKELPQVLIMENVPQVHSGKNMPEFQKWIDFLTSLGYSSKFQDMNAVDYGVAQSRNRTIMVSLLGDYDFEFPKPIPLTKVMADYLDEEVDERFYVNTDKAQDLIDRLIREGRLPEPDPKDVYPLH